MTISKLSCRQNINLGVLVIIWFLLLLNILSKIKINYVTKTGTERLIDFRDNNHQ